MVQSICTLHVHCYTVLCVLHTATFWQFYYIKHKIVCIIQVFSQTCMSVCILCSKCILINVQWWLTYSFRILKSDLEHSNINELRFGGSLTDIVTYVL